MLIKVPAVVGPAQLETVNQILDTAPFQDGKLSAGMAAKQVKHNEEIGQGSELANSLNALVMNNLVRHPVFKNAVLPHRVAAPFYARYTEGMSYGDHIDDPVMGAPNHYRSDVSCTVFLNAPEDYDGGELVINTAFGPQKVKLPAGHGVLYPSSSLHQVAEVTRGERRVMVTWIQSMIRDPAQRELLYELSQVRDRLLRKAPGKNETKKIDHVYVNLVRMWAEV
ncbi:MAG TPA: Fe2+-dependent dioxygenase [Gammaproteobacteria bacterium]|nr:Fe2+-dependent dioxygenase [Gammaproteobacteria bacterium]